MRRGQKHIKGEVRNKSLKIRLNDAEYNELDKIAQELDVTKAEITRTAIKKYLLENNDIEIWTR